MADYTFDLDGANPYGTVVSEQVESEVGASDTDTSYRIPPGFNHIVVAFPSMTASTKLWAKSWNLAGTVTTISDTAGSTYPAATFGSNTIRDFLVPPNSDFIIAASRVTATYSLSAFVYKG